jgi:acyl-CoA thioesterase
VDANELASRVAQQMLADEGTGPAWGIRIDEVREGYCRLSMTLRDDMLNGHRTAHGGIVFALADTAFAYICNGDNHRTVAAQASIVFLGSAEAGETLIAEGEEVATSGRSGVTRVSVKTAEGRDVAEFTGYSRTIGGAVIEI